MIKELEKQEAIHIWNNHYQGTFAPSAFEELLRTNDIINQELWNKELNYIKNTINSDLFESFEKQYQTHHINQELQELASFVKEGKEYLVLNLCSNQNDNQFKACFLVDSDYTVQYLCVDSKIEIAVLNYQELNRVYSKYKELMPPPLEYVDEFNRMNEEFLKLKRKNVDLTVYQAWFKLVPNIRLEANFAKAYNTYQGTSVGLFDKKKKGIDIDVFEYIPIL